MVPIGVVHVGVSLALASILLAAHRKIHPLPFLQYWAMYWIAIAANLLFAPVAAVLNSYPHLAWLHEISAALAIAVFPVQPVFMLLAALSLGKPALPARTIWKWMIPTGALCLVIGLTRYMMGPGVPALQPIQQLRPILAGLAAAAFGLRLAFYRSGKAESAEFGSRRASLVACSMVYGAHSILLGLSGWGLHFYPERGNYTPWAAAVGILLQFALTMALTYQAFDHAQQAAGEAREAERRFHSLLDTVRLAGLILDRNGRVLFCNQHLLGLLGRQRANVLESDWLAGALPPDRSERALARQVFAEGLQSGNWPAIHEYSILAGSGHELQFQWYHTALRDSEGAVTGVASLGLDVTQQRLLEEQLKQVQKMETLGRLAGGVAHDFNNYLTVINGYSDLLLSKLKRDDSMAAWIQEIRAAGKRAADLTNQLLAFGRQQHRAPKAMSLNEAVRGAQGMLRSLVREEIEIDLGLDPDTGVILADSGEIDQILLNLVVNAGDAITGPGRVTIRTANYNGRVRGSNRALSDQHGRYVLLAVQDTGCGIDRHTQSRIFEPFFTTKAIGKGTGLGLATVFGIVAQSGGSVEVSSELGVGSLFRVYLPRVDAVVSRERVTHAELARNSGGTILLVEDQTAVRKLAAAVLNSAGYAVLEASGGKEALRLAEDRSLAISMVMTDIVMPEMNGRELVAHLEPIRPGTPVLFVSGYEPDASDSGVSVEDAPRPGGARSAFLRKPYTRTELLDLVDSFIRTNDQVA